MSIRIFSANGSSVVAPRSLLLPRIPLAYEEIPHLIPRLAIRFRDPQNVPPIMAPATVRSPPILPVCKECWCCLALANNLHRQRLRILSIEKLGCTYGSRLRFSFRWGEPISTKGPPACSLLRYATPYALGRCFIPKFR